MATKSSARSDQATRPLETLLDEAVDSAENGKVTVGTLLEAFGSRSFGPLISIFALIAAVPPIGGIPGIPTSMGVLVALIAVQLLFGQRHPWVPGFLKQIGFDRKKVEKARDKSQSWLGRIDTLIGRRLDWAATGIAERLAAACCVVIAAMMPPLELLPFAAALPASAILMFGLGLTARDGLLMLIGFAATAGAAYLVIANFILG